MPFPEGSVKYIKEGFNKKTGKECLQHVKQYLKKKKNAVQEVIFDYSTENGIISFGKDDKEFRISFSRASDTSIHVYQVPEMIRKIALVKDHISILDILRSPAKLESLDFSSNQHTLMKGEALVLQNVFGVYAAIHIINIRDRTIYDDRDEVTFKFIIQDNPNDSNSASRTEKAVS